MIDLVIKNEKNMDLFIRFLVTSLNTIDGIRDSAKPIFKSSYKKEVRIREKMLKSSLMKSAGDAQDMYKK